MINQERLLHTFLSLLEINSPSRKEGAVSRVIAEKLTQLGCSVVTDNAGSALGGEVGNIIATLPACGEGGVDILLCSHMDTVQPTEGIRILQEDGIIRQEGAAVLGADDKAGIAAIIEGVQSVVESQEAHGQIQILILICEEIGLLGSKELDMSAINSDLGFVFDSGQPVGHLVSSAPTHDNIVIRFHGRAAHAGVCPEEGASAIQAAARAIAAMKLGRIDEETTANVGIVQGGSARNIIPESCELRAEARSRDTKKLDEQVAAMRKACEDAAVETGVEVTVEVTREYLGYKHAATDPLMEFGLRAARSIGMESDLVAHGGGSDCNILNAKGLPTAVVGVGYEKIHTPEEFISVSDLVRCAQYARALVRASGKA
ncbi:MAG: M20/M25/M40 family metallo-hydrolase [Armatimonadetes bacterium]|nr:M20/M25/M40 family metallo-hydrolase [Armatimonadota bacterium]